MAALEEIRQACLDLYGEKTGQETFQHLQRMLMQSGLPGGVRRGQITARDALLITYGDQVSRPGTPPLQSLAEFSERYLAGLVSGIHLLPFFPSSSDDGF